MREGIARGTEEEPFFFILRAAAPRAVAEVVAEVVVLPAPPITVVLVVAGSVATRAFARGSFCGDSDFEPEDEGGCIVVEVLAVPFSVARGEGKD